MCRVIGNLDDPRGFDRNLSLSASEKRRVRLLVELSLLRARKASQPGARPIHKDGLEHAVFYKNVCVLVLA